ncbi:restriction endonuclease subunit S [Marinobacterium jannaschii]|uniref:restriction endonuclease subunit S n=1 Tax=Marinobacterium jannaschii TaxID=64970 RepID=UPI000684B439|nr:restriction endonuclease subunit S [Marinobacterium jannaschii]
MAFPQVKLKDCCTVVGGATPKRNVEEYWGDDVPWITPKDISQLNHPILEDAPEYISQKGYESCATYMLPKGSVLLTSRAPIGNVAIAGRDMCTNQGFKSLVPGEQVDGSYLYHCMKFSAQRLDALGNGATFKEVSKKVVEEFEIPLPPQAEQQRIAALLDKADALRRKRQQAIDLADQFLRSVFLDMFGDPATNPKGWKLVSLRSLITDWKPGVTIQPDKFTEDGFSVFHKGAVLKNGRIAFDSKKKTHTSKEFAESNIKAVIGSDYIAVNLRDLVPTGPSIGLMADLSCYGDKNYLLAYGAYGFKVDRKAVAPEYLVALTNQRGFRRELAKVWVGSTQIHIRKDDFFDLKLPFPDYELQREFQSIVYKVRASVVPSMKAFDIDDFFASLSQQAFSGQL